jgi:hypothetical protein
MASYRLYCLRDGRIVKGDWLEADSDSQAIAATRAQNPNADCELWLGKRLVARIPATGGAVLIDPMTGRGLLAK